MSTKFDKGRYEEAVNQMTASWASGDHKNAVRVMHEIQEERQRQDAKWGEQNHDDTWWLAILMEEVGELAQAMLHSSFGGPHAGTERTELTQVAAVAVQWLEAMRRRETVVCRWSWHHGGRGYWKTSCASDKNFTGKKGEVKSCHGCGRPVEWVTAVSQETQNP